MHATDVWGGRSLGAILARLTLLPASALYALGWESYRGIYRIGFKRARHPHTPILCVGNLTVGGSGKSPVALYIANHLQELGRKVVLGCSGYGSPRASGASVAPEGDLSAREWGDEPAMFRWIAPDIPLIVGRGRVAAAELCAAAYPNAVLVMDDGFQHLPLAKDISILLDDPNPKNRFCLPAGPYREPRWNRARADLVLPAEFTIRYGPPIVDGVFPGSEVNALCALGQPQPFFEGLAKAGFRLRNQLALPDHCRLDSPDLFETLAPKVPLLVTAKDWVKLRERTDIEDRSIHVVRRGVTIEPEADFVRWLADRLHELETSPTEQ